MVILLFLITFSISSLEYFGLFTDEKAGWDKSRPVSRIATALFLPVRPSFSPTISPPIAVIPPFE